MHESVADAVPVAGARRGPEAVPWVSLCHLRHFDVQCQLNEQGSSHEIALHYTLAIL